MAVHAARAARAGLDLDAVERAGGAAIEGVRLVATVDAVDRLTRADAVLGDRGAWRAAASGSTHCSSFGAGTRAAPL